MESPDPDSDGDGGAQQLRDGGGDERREVPRDMGGEPQDDAGADPENDGNQEAPGDDPGQVVKGMFLTAEVIVEEAEMLAVRPAARRAGTAVRVP